jgi:hypothetical protein
VFLLIPLFCRAQAQAPAAAADTGFVKLANDFVKELYQPGLELVQDSIYVSEEFSLMLKDSNYRSVLYPKVYTWNETTELLKAKRLKHAFWFLINLYSEGGKTRELVMQIVLTYDKIFEMDKIMTSTYYTYIFFDPRVSIINNGKPEIIHPDVSERIMNNVKEINNYIQYFRENPPTGS